MLEVTTTEKAEVTYCLTIFFNVPEALSIDVSAVRSCRTNMSVLCYGWQEEEKKQIPDLSSSQFALSAFSECPGYLLPAPLSLRRCVRSLEDA